MGKLVQLEVNNFKSYRGHHVLLFGDSYFTSVIGPNGSGKSNSMDAISFALGVKSSHLRSTNLRDLIYRGRVIRTAKINADGTATEANGDEAAENGDSQTSSQRNDPQSAWVMAVFEDDAEQEHKWKRTITSSGQSEYRINNRVVSAKQYQDALEEQGILVKARNFLVFQGDVEKVASQDPKDLTRLIEQISGSLEYKADYERLKEVHDQATENNAHELAQRRQIGAEIKTYEAQKAEADAYQAKVKERDEAVVTHVLWKLFHFQQTMQASSDEIARHQEELKEHKRRVAKYEAQLDQARQAHAKAAREVNKTEKAIKGKEKELEDAHNNLVPIDEKVKISTKDLQKYEARIATLAKDRDTQNQLVIKYKKDLETVQRAQKKWEDEFKAKAQQEGRELTAQDLQEYNRLRGEVTKQTHASQIEVNKLQREIGTEEDHVKNLKAKVDGLESQSERLENDINELQNRQQELDGQTKAMEQERATKQKEYTKLQADRDRVASQQLELNQNLQDTLKKLYEADSGRRQSERETKARETVSAMKRAFGAGVRGRYLDLVKPKQVKYQTAVSTLLGWYMDAIIVDTDRVAKDCIQYLKTHRLGQFTFIPLDTISIKAVNPSLKGMHKGMRLGIDCIDYDNSLERAVAAACGNSMICDDLKIAKYLCYEKRVDAKAVTLDGIVIAKGGTMTGGRLGSDKGSQRWNDAQVDNLTKLKDKYLASLAALPKADRRSQEEETLQADLSDLADRIRLNKEEIKSLDHNIRDKQRELKFVKSQLKESRPKYNEGANRLQKSQNELKLYQDAINQVADQVYAAFCQRLGYASIRDYEAQQGGLQQEAAERRVEFTRQRSRLENTIQFHESQLQTTNDRIAQLEDKSKRDEALIKGFEAEKEELQNQIDVLNAELEGFHETLNSLQEKLSRRSTVVSEARSELKKQNEAVGDVMKAVEGLESDIRRTAAQRYTLLKDCRVKEINIPLAQGSASLNSLPLGDNVHLNADAMDIDEDPDVTQIQQPEIDDYGIEVDFDDLDDDLKDDNSTACEAKLEDIIKALDTEINSANPNMRSGERLQSTKERFKATEKTWEETKKLNAKAKKEFEDVKRKREELFKKAFNHISANIAGTYKELTRDAKSPLGGQAYLDMEDDDEPYLYGLKYHAMPPMKRFRDMEHLSGGEKTIAALALLFAIHSYQPSPFFVLDEVDAALDNVNVGRVAKYVREHASPGMQFIVISLKSGLFQESESLVGVMRDQSRMSSRVVSLDLRKYLPS